MSRYEEKPHVSETRAARSATEMPARRPGTHVARVAAARHENASSNPLIPAMADSREHVAATTSRRACARLAQASYARACSTTPRHHPVTSRTTSTRSLRGEPRKRKIHLVPRRRPSPPFAAVSPPSLGPAGERLGPNFTRPSSVCIATPSLRSSRSSRCRHRPSRIRPGGTRSRFSRSRCTASHGPRAERGAESLRQEKFAETVAHDTDTPFTPRAHTDASMSCAMSPTSGLVSGGR